MLERNLSDKFQLHPSESVPSISKEMTNSLEKSDRLLSIVFSSTNSTGYSSSLEFEPNSSTVRENKCSEDH